MAGPDLGSIRLAGKVSVPSLPSAQTMMSLRETDDGSYLPPSPFVEEGNRRILTLPPHLSLSPLRRVGYAHLFIKERWA
jgi:hypothetical protein